MVSDQEIVNGVESLLRQSNPEAVTTINGVVQQLEAKLGLDLSHKAGFIRDLLGGGGGPPKDHFALQHFPQFHSSSQQFPTHFALPPNHIYQQNYHPQQELNFRYPPPQPQQLYPYPLSHPQQRQHPRPNPNPLPQAVNTFAPTVAEEAGTTEFKKERCSVPAGTKRRGGPGGLNKVCGVSPELQAVVGEPALPRTQIVKQLWAYIRKHNLQDPSNKRKIICNDALRLVFETDCTDMFKMNKLLAKHIIALDPTKEPGSDSKRSKVEAESATENTEPAPEVILEADPEVTTEAGSLTVVISAALARFYGIEEREIAQSEAVRRLWEHIKVNKLEDQVDPMMIMCDPKLQELFGCKSISALEIPEMLMTHFFKHS